MSGTGSDDAVVLRMRPERTECLEALLLGAGPHLAAATDIGTAANGDLLLMLAAPTARLSQVLLGRPTAGEAVTVLVPLAQTLHRLHAAGVAHGAVDVEHVLLDEEGSPYWAPPETPTLRRRSGPTAFAEQAAADAVGFRGLCATLLDPLGVAVPEEPELGSLAGALFALAAPEPVRMRPVVEPFLLGTPSRLLPASSGLAAVRPTSTSPASGERLRGALRSALRALGGLRTVRRRVWIALGSVTAALLAAAVLLPAASAAEGTRSAAGPRLEHEVVSAPPPVAPRALPARSALPALLAERERCLVAGSESCLHRVDAVGSPVLRADLAAVRAGTTAVRVDRSRLRPPSGDGGTALVRGGGATVLAVREQHGWRLRDVVAEPPEG